MQRDLGRVFELGLERRNYELISTSSTTSRNFNIAQFRRSSEVVDTYDKDCLKPLLKLRIYSYVPLRPDCTLKGIPEIGTLPTAVLAVTSAVPFRPRVRSSDKVTAANIASNAPLLIDFNGWFVQDKWRSASLPVETPPSAADLGRTS